jgi:2'-5' RNA ligase
VRAFVAIELDDACCGRLVRAISVLEPVVPGVRWLRPGAIHLTLKFIGDLAEEDVPAAISCIEPAAVEASPFEMTVEGLAGFPPRGVPRVIHVGVREESGVLLALQSAIDKALKGALGIAPEGRRYAPHITLGRTKRRDQCPTVAQIAAALDDDRFGVVAVDSFLLMESDLRPDGAVHTPVHRFDLGPG